MSNPVLNETYWSKLRDAERSPTTMTVEGAIGKTAFLTLLLAVSASWMWVSFWNGGRPEVGQFLPFFIGGAIVGLLAGLALMFLPAMAMGIGIVYALAEGLFIGGLTMIVQAKHPGLPLLAAAYTAATLVGMLLLYRTGIIKASNGFIRGVMGATAGLMLGVALLWVLGMFGVGEGVRAMLYGGGAIGIGFSLLCIGLAALNLVVDFAFIERGAEGGAPKRMEWVAAMGLLVTLVWLYIEILRLLAKLRR